ncbi:MAG: glycosyltransferase, partial [Planctomycetes bacterium]|nr:glycosyltransferase [Planctomycetota bacterium]
AYCGIEDLERIAVIPQGNHIDDYPNEIGREAARAALGVAAEPLMFLFLGRVRPYKGVFELIDGFVRAALPRGSLLHIAGKTHGERDRLRLKKRCRKTPSVTLHYGFVEAERVQVFMNAADFVVLPYRDILSSGAAILATSFGKAIVAPDLGPLREAVAPEGAILYDPAATGALARALEAAARAAPQSAEMGERNLAVARAWPWSSMAECTRALYLRVMEGRTARAATE